ncbi:MAG TPA: hypothetical protein VNW97_16010 [Candidatus Saccharimonadales bacterium]|nr:hypothetical protein [Candidatus Saccharimonadales bacterium]
MAASIGCGGSSSSATRNGPKATGLKKRALVSNQFSSAVQLLDAQNDKFATSISVNSPTKLLTRGIVTAVLDSNSNTVALIDNPSERVMQQPTMPGPITDIALSSDGKTAYAAMRSLGLLGIINVPDGSFVTVGVPGITRLVLSPNNGKVLGFSDDAQSLPSGNADAFFVIDAVSHVAFTVIGPAGAQPYSAVFNGSDTSAFILNCAAECGGSASTPSIAQINLSGTPTLGAAMPLPAGAGATVGLLSGSNIFLAGTPTAGAGSLVVFNTGSNAFSTVLSIQDGLHTRMAMSSNGRLYVGSSGCTVLPSGNNFQGCLAIFDTAQGVTQSAITKPTFSSFRSAFNVTGLQPISGRNVIYIVEGGELDIFDITTNTLTATQIDVVGSAFDVVQIDP